MGNEGNDRNASSQARLDAIAKSRARRSQVSGRRSSGNNGAPIPRNSMNSRSAHSASESSATDQQEESTGLLPDVVRRREQRAAARAERLGHRSHVSEQQQQGDVLETGEPHNRAESSSRHHIGLGSEEDRQQRFEAKMAQVDQQYENSVEQRGANPAESTPASSARTMREAVFSNMTEEERQQRYDSKMAEMGQEHHDSRDKRGVAVEEDSDDDVPERAPISALLMDQYEKHPHDVPGQNNNMARPEATFTDRGIAITPDVERGALERPLLDDLAVAIPIDDENDEEEKDYVVATEYDPDSKPPLHKNRRFRLYSITGGCFCLVMTIALVAILASRGGTFSKKALVLTGPPTEAPTVAPTSARESTYHNLFAQRVSDKVFDTTTPNHRAAEWIMNEDPKQLNPDDVDILQRYILALFYFQTSEMETSPWKSCNAPKDGDDESCVFIERTVSGNELAYVNVTKTRWLSGEEECRWAGVACASGSSVLSIELQDQDLSGNIPSELAALPFLQQVALPFNQLKGTIPSEFTSMRHLNAFEAHYNLLSGSIPSDFFKENSLKLQVLNLGDNMLTGSIETEMGYLTNLKGLFLFENNMAGNIPSEFGSFNYLAYTRMNGNAFTGSLPTELGNLYQLVEFWYHENLFIGPLPTEIGAFRRLNDLRLWGNDFTGTVPEEYFSLSNLIRLSVRENKLTGTLSPSVKNLSKLIVLKVNSNILTGPIPVEIQELPSVQLIHLHLNQFEGAVPTEICSIFTPGRLQFLQADCSPEDNPPNSCLCCNACCDRTTQTCFAV